MKTQVQLGSGGGGVAGAALPGPAGVLPLPADTHPHRVQVTSHNSQLIVQPNEKYGYLDLYLPSAAHNTTSSPGLVLQPVVPGLNLPASQLLHYTASLGLASVLHEAGHALAAHTAHIRTLGAGLLIMVGRV